jgi:cytochrome c oxidase subunit 2
MDEGTATGGATTGPVTARARRAAAAAALAVGLTAAWARGAEVEVSVSSAGFRPAELTLRKGETLRVRLVATDREHCFAIDALRVEKRVVPGKRTTVELVPDRAGTFPFHCCLEPENAALRGRLVVTE